MIEPICQECGKLATLVQSREIYVERHDLWGKPMWRCQCGAYVGCHPHTEIPMGYPAGPQTRRARSQAHAVFDALWLRKAERDKIPKGKARVLGYAWLAKVLGLDPRDTHISHFSKEMALRVVEVCRNPPKDAPDET